MTSIRAAPVSFQLRDPISQLYLVVNADGSFQLLSYANTLARKSCYYVLPAISRSMVVMNSTGAAFRRRYFSPSHGWTTEARDTPSIRILPGSACNTAHVLINNAYMHPPDTSGKIQTLPTPYDWLLESASSAFRMKVDADKFIACDTATGSVSVTQEDGSASVFQWFNGNIFQSGSLQYDASVDDYTANVIVVLGSSAKVVLNMPSRKWPIMNEDNYSAGIALTKQSVAVFLSVPNSAGEFSLATSLKDSLKPIRVDIALQKYMAVELTANQPYAHPGMFPYALRGGCVEATTLATVESQTTCQSQATNSMEIWLPVTVVIVIAIVVFAVIMAAHVKHKSTGVL